MWFCLCLESNWRWSAGRAMCTCARKVQGKARFIKVLYELILMKLSSFSDGLLLLKDISLLQRRGRTSNGWEKGKDFGSPQLCLPPLPLSISWLPHSSLHDGYKMQLWQTHTHTHTHTHTARDIYLGLLLCRAKLLPTPHTHLQCVL